MLLYFYCVAQVHGRLVTPVLNVSKIEWLQELPWQEKQNSKNGNKNKAVSWVKHLNLSYEVKTWKYQEIIFFRKLCLSLLSKRSEMPNYFESLMSVSLPESDAGFFNRTLIWTAGGPVKNSKMDNSIFQDKSCSWTLSWTKHVFLKPSKELQTYSNLSWQYWQCQNYWFLKLYSIWFWMMFLCITLLLYDSSVFVFCFLSSCLWLRFDAVVRCSCDRCRSCDLKLAEITWNQTWLDCPQPCCLSPVNNNKKNLVIWWGQLFCCAHFSFDLDIRVHLRLQLISQIHSLLLINLCMKLLIFFSQCM